MQRKVGTKNASPIPKPCFRCPHPPFFSCTQDMYQKVSFASIPLSTSSSLADSLVGAIVFMPYIYKTIYLVVSWIMIIMDKGWSKWLIVVFQVFDLVMFLVISSVLADSAANGKLFSYKCTPWARF